MRRGLILSVIVAAACAKGPAPAGDLSADATHTELDALADGPNETALAAERRARKIAEAREALDGGTWTGGELYATSARTSVMNVPAWPEDSDAGIDPSPSVYRLGYLRNGSHVSAFPETIVNEECPDGWYELLEGGFVCGKHATLDAKTPSVKYAASPPSLGTAMPYRYGYATGNDTPVYRRVLSLMDRRKYEPWLIPPPPVTVALPVLVPESTDTPYDEAPLDEKLKLGVKDAGAKDAGVIKLGSLKGRGVLARKMMKGFYVALDRDFTAAKAKWWRTAEGFAIPYERIALQSWSPDFHGSWVVRAASTDGGTAAEGNGKAALVSTAYAVHFQKNEKGKMIYGTPLAKWTALELVGEPLVEGGVVFHETTSGFFVRAVDLKLATPEKPADLAPGEKWIDVDLPRQMLIAFEGDHPVYGTLVSSGRRTPWDPEHDHPTPTGTFRIYEKHVTATMDGDVAADGPYSIEDVPWVMFFQGSYALHGAFWHNLFGTPRSHGCVNLSPIDARELFFWTEPRLPKGWHGVFQARSNGTRVVIHEPPQPLAPKK
ncbi:MAG: L,D-transpeptidase [Polyangiaceae bacterium]